MARSKQNLYDQISSFTQREKEKARRKRAVKEIRERLSAVPFYAERAAKRRLDGGRDEEFRYWLDLQGD